MMRSPQRLADGRFIDRWEGNLIPNLRHLLQISVTADWQIIMKVPTGDSSPLTAPTRTAAGIK